MPNSLSTFRAAALASLTVMILAFALRADAADVVVYDTENAPATPKLAELPLKDRVSQYGITWTFDRPARVGRFLTGDWYVVGPVTIKAIDPAPLFGDEVKAEAVEQGDIKESLFPGQRARNGSTLNLPAIASVSKVTKRAERAGFDSRMPMAAYDPEQFTRLPIAMKAGDSLVSSISAEPIDRGFPIQAVAILTCVAAPQPPDAFRPSFCQTGTCKPYLARNLRRDLLLKLPKPASAAKIKPAGYSGEGYFQEPWMDNVAFGRAMPRKKFQFYGANIAELVGGSTLLLNLDYTPAEKEPLLLGVIQAGIDLHGLLRGGASWSSEGGGGGAAGRKWPILFSGLMLDDPAMHSLSKSFPDSRWLEDDETAFCPVDYQGKTYQRGWTGAKVIWTGHYGYYKGQFAPKAWESGYGPVELFPPEQWPSPWNIGSESYRRGMTSGAWVAQALAARLMHAEKNWDHDAFFAYEDRWMTEDDEPIIAAMLKNAEAKLAAAKSDEEKRVAEEAIGKIKSANRSGTITGRPELVPLVKDLWTKYRDHLPPSLDRASDGASNGASNGAKVPPAADTWK